MIAIALLAAAAALFLGLAIGSFLMWWREREQVTYLRARLAEATPPLTPVRAVAMNGGRS